MGLFDDSGFGHVEEKQVSLQSNETTSDFDRTLVMTVSPLLKMAVINKEYNLKDLLERAGIEVNTECNMYCPFHMDSLTGKKSAKYHSSSDKLYCFSESKIFSAYHALKLIYGYNTNRIFMTIWSKMSKGERLNYLQEYDPSHIDANLKEEESLLSTLCSQVLVRFQREQVTFTQYKKALYKVLIKVEEDSKNHENSSNKTP